MKANVRLSTIFPPYNVASCSSALTAGVQEANEVWLLAHC